MFLVKYLDIILESFPMAKILIIEDDGDLQHALSLAFNREGYEVHYAFNGKEGYEKVLAAQPDVIVLDLMMPVLDGYEVIKLVTTNIMVRDIPIIVMTGNSDRPDLLEITIKSQGVREYLRKPFEVEMLKRLVRKMLVQYPRKAPTPTQIAKGVIRLDTRFRTVWIGDKLVATLSPTKAELLQALMESRGAVKREKLLTAIWGKTEQVNALEKAIQRLRQDH